MQVSAEEGKEREVLESLPRTQQEERREAGLVLPVPARIAVQQEALLEDGLLR